VLATLDEASYQPGDGAMGRDHPIAWSHAFEGGRAWYTAGGHTEEAYAEPLFLAHVLGGIRYAAKLQPPHVTGLALTVRGRRIGVEARYVRCRQCAATLRVRSGSRSLVRTGQARNGLARASSPVLAAGRWRVSLTVEDRSTARRTTVQRIVQIR
jgi:hypothetical protein